MSFRMNMRTLIISLLAVTAQSFTVPTFARSNTSLQGASGGWGVGNARVLAVTAQSFTGPTFTRSNTALQGASGGWGVGNARDMVPEEFAKGDRRAFEGYSLRDRGEFMRQVKSDKENMELGELDELLGVAAMAGIKVKDPSTRLNKFDIDDEGDDLDVSVQWESASDPFEEREIDDSITRMDEDTGASGVW